MSIAYKRLTLTSSLIEAPRENLGGHQLVGLVGRPSTSSVTHDYEMLKGISQNQKLFR